MKKEAWARDEALTILTKILREGAYSNIALKQGLDKSSLSRVDKALVTEIVNGTLKNLIKIDWIISQFTANNKSKISPLAEDIIRCGVYQIFYLDRVPDSAVCNECAELARKHSHEGVVKFVNGVLRNIARNKDGVKLPERSDMPERYLSIMYSHPEWMVKKWAGDYGLSFTEDLLKANNTAPLVSVRANSLKTTREKLKEMLIKEGIECEDGTYYSEALYLKGTSSIDALEAYKQGLFQVQDESSMLAAKILDPKPGELIIDVCSAPGGKATHMAELMKNEGKILARDVHDHKLRLISQSCKRLGITIVEPQLYNAKSLDGALVQKADRVMVDAPCSGLGVIRRKPDMRWKKEPDDFRELMRIQTSIMETSSRYVKKGGVLIYSTCTLNKNENLGVVESFLNKTSGFYLEDISKLLPEHLEVKTAPQGYLELYPNIHGTDGFFIARLKRR